MELAQQRKEAQRNLFVSKEYELHDAGDELECLLFDQTPAEVVSPSCFEHIPLNAVRDSEVETRVLAADCASGELFKLPNGLPETFVDSESHGMEVSPAHLHVSEADESLFDALQRQYVVYLASDTRVATRRGTRIRASELWSGPMREASHCDGDGWMPRSQTGTSMTATMTLDSKSASERESGSRSTMQPSRVEIDGQATQVNVRL